MNITFWGVRGSVAVSGGGFARTGGNTPCVEIEHQGARLLLDGGTGLAAMGASVDGPIDAALLFTHVHWDHIQGVPFFRPAFRADSRLVLVGAPGLYDALSAQMRPPSFPVGIDAFRARVESLEVGPDAPFGWGPFEIRASELSHPDGVYAWRISAGGRSVVFATDVEHGGELDPRLVALAEGVDLLIHDAQYTDEEYPAFRGWGHSTWQQAVAVASAAEVDRLALFHHDPTRTDDRVARIEAQAARARRGTFAAREGAVVAL